jgi:phosphoglycolate phosphatase
MTDYCFLFDIDGTLVDMRELWEQTYHKIYADVCGITLRDAEMRSLFGPAALEAHRGVLLGRQVDSELMVEELASSEEKSIISVLEDQPATPYLLPGVEESLQACMQLGVVGCVTGNMEPVANSILRSSGLRDYFSFLACALPTTTAREEIVLSAQEKLAALGNLQNNNIYVIGDTPSDIKAARACGLISVGVTTGHYNADELKAENPDYLLNDLNNFPAVLDLD